MKRLGMLLLAVMVLAWALPYNVDVKDPEGPSPRPGTPMMDRVFIDSVGDIRAILGSQGKSIVVSGGGEAIAVFYGAPSGDPNNSMLASVAYSLDGGATWTTYGPFSGAGRRMYNGVDAVSDFNSVAGHLWFCYQVNTQGYNDGEIDVMIEENVPSAPSFSVPTILPNSQPPAMFPWEPDIAVDPDNPSNLVATAWSFLANGNEWAYCWISDDGGYTWTDTIPMALVTQDGACGNLARGTGGYVVYTYQDYGNVGGTDSTPVPYYMESTDGGYTWSAETRVPNVPATSTSQFWWHEMDCMVVNNEPWFMHNDIGSPGGGPYVMKGTGSPGSWTWSIWDIGLMTADSTWYNSELWQMGMAQYPSLSYDPVNGMILASAKGHFYYGPGPSPGMWTQPHLVGMYTMDGGNTWQKADPLSTYATTLIYADWNGTEVATHMPHFGNYSKTYTVWVDEIALVLYFESEFVTPYGPPLGVEEITGNLVGAYRFGVTPSVTTNNCRATFTLPSAANIALKVYDVSGRVVDNVFSGQANGEQEFNINTSRLANGTYFVVLETEQGNTAHKIVTLH
jgi:hypothetical protein